MSKLLFNPLSGNFDIVYNKAEEIEFVPAVPAQWSGTIANTEEALNTIKADIADNQALVKEPTGFVDRTSTTLSINSMAREFTISPVGASFDVYVKGNKYTKTAESIVLSNTSGNHYIYYNAAGVLSETSIFDPSIFENNALVSIIYWNTDTNFYSYFADERHGLVMDGATHGYLHTVFGARYLNGLALQGFTVDGDGDADISAKFQADSGKIRDEDILVELPLTLNIPVLYREGALWRKKPADPYPVIYNGSVAGYSSARLAFNEFTGGAWQLTQVTDGDFVLCHVFATNDIETPFVAIAGINQYANIPAARAGAESEISSLSGLPFAEFVAVGTVIYQTDSAYNNTPKARVRSAAAGETYVDFRGEQLYTPSGVATSHSLLSNLSSDDHVQYFNAARGDARYVLKTGDTMTGTLSVDVSGAGTSNLAWSGVSILSSDSTEASDYTLSGVSTSITNPGVSQFIGILTPDSLSITELDTVAGTTTQAAIQSGQMSLTFDDGLGPVPTLPTQPQHVTTKKYVDDSIVSSDVYTPSSSGDWLPTVPTTVIEALDSLAANKAGPVTDAGTVAGGQSLVNITSPTDVKIKGLKAGAGISITSDVGFNNLVIDAIGAGGEVNTASNLGATGEGLFAQKTGTDLEFKKLIGGTNITLTSDADSVTVSSSAGVVTLKAITTFAASGTWTKPSGLNYILVEVQGGGGAGAACNSAAPGGGGGGAGGYSKKFIVAASLGATETVTVAAAAGTSSFGAFCSATGGAAGQASGATGGLGGTGGLGSGGNINLKGNDGGTGAQAEAAGPQGTGGAGGASAVFGGAGRGGEHQSGGTINGVAGQPNSGSGGGGGGRNPSTGGAGATGFVVVYEYGV
jgi:hypothetical protein